MNDLKLTLTITSCQRYYFFEKTINSFLESCLDIDLIDQIILIDDNSCQDDLIKMENLLKKFNKDYIIFKKCPDNKGHQRSLNILFDNIKTDYILHLEDDWFFDKKDNFISKSLQIMNESPDIKQVLLLTRRIMANNQKIIKTKDGIEYIKYRFDGQYHMSRAGQPAWPGWNLNPSIWNFKDIKNTLGKFSNDVNNFEFKYSRAFWKAGLKVAYFPVNYCYHLGDKDSSYKLNGTMK